MLPVDRNITFELESADVIHSFWIPAMGQSRTSSRESRTSIIVTPTRTGIFPLVCTELCGLGHATMRSVVRVGGAGGVRQVGRGAEGRLGGRRRRRGGLRLRGLRWLPRVRPGWVERRDRPQPRRPRAAAARLPGRSEADFVRDSIVDPDKEIAPDYAAGVTPGNFGESLSDEEIDALVTYLTEAK